MQGQMIKKAIRGTLVAVTPRFLVFLKHGSELEVLSAVFVPDSPGSRQGLAYPTKEYAAA